MADDPVHTDPDKYSVIFENEHVRVLEYRDRPGDRTTPHNHPDSVMYTLSSFRRRLYSESGDSRDVELTTGMCGWVPAQRHAGHNVGSTDSHAIFVELKDRTAIGDPGLGPSD